MSIRSSIRNGGKRWAWLALAFGGVSATSTMAGWYGGWRSNVEASVLERRMINDNDAKLRRLIEDFQMNAGADAVQQTRIESHEESIDELLRSQIRTEQSVKNLSDLVFYYMKSRMQDGEIKR